MILKKTGAALTGGLLVLGIALPLGNVDSRNVAAKDVSCPRNSECLNKQTNKQSQWRT